MLLATRLAPIGVLANSTWRLTAETRASWVEKIAPDAVAERSSSLNKAATDSASTIEALFAASTSTVETTELSRALADGSRVASKSREEEMPRIEIDFAVFRTGFTVVLPSSSDHPQVLTHGFLPWPISLK